MKLWVYDKMRYGLHPLLRMMWTLIGKRVIAPDQTHVIIGDGAGFHHKEEQDHEGRLPANVPILTLPPYSPELNPIEKLWDVVKGTICTINWKDLTELESKLTEVLKSWWERPEGFASLFVSSYLRTELNASKKTFRAIPFC